MPTPPIPHATPSADLILPVLDPSGLGPAGYLTLGEASGLGNTLPGNLDADDNRIVNLGNPSAGSDADTKNARDAAIAAAIAAFWRGSGTKATLDGLSDKTTGQLAFCTNGRNTGESSSAGTGCLVTRGASTWIAVWSGVTVTV